MPQDIEPTTEVQHDAELLLKKFGYAEGKLTSMELKTVRACRKVATLKAHEPLSIYCSTLTGRRLLQ
jgi:hypothetical protein